MNAEHADFAPVRFSTDDLPERDRIPAWRDFFGPRIFNAEIEPAADAPFRIDVTVRTLPQVGLMSSYSSLAGISRTPALLADGRDQLCLVVSSSEGVARCRGREFAYRPGDAFLTSVAEAVSSTSPFAAHYRGVFVPPTALAHMVPDLESALPQLIRSSNEHLG